MFKQHILYNVFVYKGVKYVSFNKIADSHPVRGAARYVVGLYHRVNAGGM